MPAYAKQIDTDVKDILPKKMSYYWGGEGNKDRVSESWVIKVLRDSKCFGFTMSACRLFLTCSSSYPLVRPDILDLASLIEASDLPEGTKSFLLKRSKGSDIFINLGKAYTLIHLIIHVQLRNINFGSHRTWVPLPYSLIRKITGLDSSILRKHVLLALESLKVIEIHKIKSHGPSSSKRLCHEYRLCKPYCPQSGGKFIDLGFPYLLTPKQETALLKSISSKIQANTQLEKCLLANNQQLRLSPEAYDAWLAMSFDSEEKRLCAQFAMETINADQKTINNIPIRGWFFNRHHNIRRIYSTVTNLPSALRSYLIHKNGQRLCEIDQRASQPFLLLRFYKDMTGDASAITKEANAFYALWNGDFYKNFAKLANELLAKANLPSVKLSRDDMKQAFIIGLNARSWQTPPKEVKKEVLKVITDTLRANFKLLYKKIHKIKTVRDLNVSKTLKKWRNGKEKIYSQFGISMQKGEAIIFIDGIARELTEKGIFCYTVHDCIGCFPKDATLVEECMFRHLKNATGFEPKFKTPHRD